MRAARERRCTPPATAIRSTARRTGFDAILENPQFAGADTSFWVRQAVPLVGGGGVALSGRNGVLASLRTSREQGQSNFVNPGLRLLGVGADFDVTPQLRVIGNVTYLWFDNTAVLAVLRNQRFRRSEIGTDVSVGDPVPAALHRRTSC